VVVLLKPSDWIVRWAHLLAPRAAVLDVACGSGRHLAWLAGQGHPVTGIDQSINAARQNAPEAELVCADIENAPWPLRDADGQIRRFGSVVVTNYLWRPLLPTLLASVAPGGVLLYETFADGNAHVGPPSRADLLVQRGELLPARADPGIGRHGARYLVRPPPPPQRIAAVRPPVAEASQPDRVHQAL